MLCIAYSIKKENSIWNLQKSKHPRTIFALQKVLIFVYILHFWLETKYFLTVQLSLIFTYLPTSKIFLFNDYDFHCTLYILKNYWSWIECHIYHDIKVKTIDTSLYIYSLFDNEWNRIKAYYFDNKASADLSTISKLSKSHQNCGNNNKPTHRFYHCQPTYHTC